MMTLTYEEDHDIGDTGDGDADPGLPHGPAHPLLQRGPGHGGLAVPGLHQHEHVVDAEADQEAEDEGVHGAVLQPEGRAQAERSNQGQASAKGSGLLLLFLLLLLLLLLPFLQLTYPALPPLASL